MFRTTSGRSFGNHQVGRAIEKSESGMKKVGKPGSSEPSHEGHAAGGALVPHAHTGVTKMEIHHKGEGRYETHTHHEGGSAPQVEHHASEQDMHDHVAQAFPSDGEHQEPDGDEGAGPMGDMAGEIGGGI